MFIHDQALPYFIELQNRLIELFPFVSCHEDNFSTYSIKIESLFVDVCSFFDSLCQTYICEQHSKGYVFKGETEIRNFAKKLENEIFFKACDYRILFEGTFRLSDKEVGINNYDGQLIVNAVQFPPEKIDSYIILPFQDWADGHSTAWWDAYTRLKHNRLANHREATLKNLIYAMAGTYVITTLREIDLFRSGGMRELYRSFLPWYWGVGGGDFAASIERLEV
ncbi:MAG: hypothetical protein ACXW1F_04720 [Halobacteriota archaeon]